MKTLTKTRKLPRWYIHISRARKEKNCWTWWDSSGTLPNPTATDKYIYKSMRLRQFDSLVVIFCLQREGSPAIAEQRHLQIRQFRLFCSNKILAESEELKRKFNIGTYNNFLWYVNQKKVFPRFYHFHFLVRRVAGWEKADGGWTWNAHHHLGATRDWTRWTTSGRCYRMTNLQLINQSIVGEKKEEESDRLRGKNQKSEKIWMLNIISLIYIFFLIVFPFYCWSSCSCDLKSS